MPAVPAMPDVLAADLLLRRVAQQYGLHAPVSGRPAPVDLAAWVALLRPTPGNPTGPDLAINRATYVWLAQLARHTNRKAAVVRAAARAARVVCLADGKCLGCGDDLTPDPTCPTCGGPTP